MARARPPASAAGVLLLAACLLGLAFSGGSLRAAHPPRLLPDATPAAPVHEPQAPPERSLAKAPVHAEPRRAPPSDGCKTTSWGEPGASRSLAYAHERQVTTNASTLAAVLAVAHTLGDPLTLEEVTSHAEREDEVCLFTPAGKDDRSATLVRVATTARHNVSLSHSAAIHVVALAKQGGPFRLSDMLDVQERRDSVRLFEARVADLSDEALLELAFGRGAPHEPDHATPGSPRAATQAGPAV